MKNPFLFSCVFLLLLLSCGGREKRSGSVLFINVVGGLQQPATLAMSDFGETVRYVPLETTDSCLIGNNPIVQVLQNHVVVTTRKQCYLFEKESGKFICSVGHIGDDPEGYNSTFCWVDEAAGLLYFERQPDQLQKYDFKGNYMGKITLSTPPGMPSYVLVSDSAIVGYYTEQFKPNAPVLATFTSEGVLCDTFPPLLQPLSTTANDIQEISVLKDAKMYGTWTESGVVFIGYKDDKKAVSPASPQALWKSEGDIRFKENFVDTIYTVTGKELVPCLVFDTGTYHWPADERTSTKDNSERALITYVSETDRFVFFQCIRGLYTREPLLYHGLYNKETKETRLGLSKDAVADDLTGFMPFVPIKTGSGGEFVGLIEAADALVWLEEHPAIEASGSLAFLKNLTDEMNPVLVLVK